MAEELIVEADKKTEKQRKDLEAKAGQVRRAPRRR